MTSVDALLTRYSEADDIPTAEEALEAIAGSPHAREVDLGDAFSELATDAVEDDDYPSAVRLQRRAVELGTEDQRIAREMLAWYLLKDGQTLAGEAEFAALRQEFDDPYILMTIGMARGDAGREADALKALDEGLELAKGLHDPEVIDDARIERRWIREELGLPPDEDDRLAPSRSRSDRKVYAVGWFPRDEHEAAVERWRDLEEDLREPDDYCKAIERALRDVQQSAGHSPSVAPLRVESLLEFAASEGLDPGDSETRAHLTAELFRQGEVIAWPPGRNDPCWCGSGGKYKRCCGGA